MIDYTTVIGIDRKHLEQFRLTWPTWIKHKPSLLNHPLLIFYDHEQVKFKEIIDIVYEHTHILSQPWPLPGMRYERQGEDRWFEPQRVKMLSGFVHVAASRVFTRYWLKLDVDTVATGQDDWIDNVWFDGNPAIIAQPWGYTKPADQMMLLDRWVENSLLDHVFSGTKPLNLKPKEGSDLVRHKRIISWCGFFDTQFTCLLSTIAEATCGPGQLPVPSQDGYMIYCATRLGLAVKREQMKARGWVHVSTMNSIRNEAAKAMQ